MPLETVRLNRVFGVVQTSQNRRPVTLFGFESASRKEYSVAAPGKPRIESGMTITAYLTEGDNWETLTGLPRESFRRAPPRRSWRRFASEPNHAVASRLHSHGRICS